MSTMLKGLAGLTVERPVDSCVTEAWGPRKATYNPPQVLLLAAGPEVRKASDTHRQTSDMQAYF